LFPRRTIPVPTFARLLQAALRLSLLRGWLLLGQPSLLGSSLLLSFDAVNPYVVGAMVTIESDRHGLASLHDYFSMLALMLPACHYNSIIELVGWHYRRRFKSLARSTFCPPLSRLTVTLLPSCFSTVPGSVLLLRITLSPLFHCFMWSRWDLNPRPQRLKVNCTTRLCDWTIREKLNRVALLPLCFSITP
jgi:hypothetical protein